VNIFKVDREKLWSDLIEGNFLIEKDDDDIIVKGKILKEI